MRHRLAGWDWQAVPASLHRRLGLQKRETGAAIPIHGETGFFLQVCLLAALEMPRLPCPNRAAGLPFVPAG